MSVINKQFTINDCSIYTFYMNNKDDPLYPEAEERLATNGKMARYFCPDALKKYALRKGNKITEGCDKHLREKKRKAALNEVTSAMQQQLEALRRENNELKTDLNNLRGMTYEDGELLDYDDILCRAMKYKKKVGIYFLISDLEIIYIGQSINIHSRIGTHCREGFKSFDKVSYIECSENDLNRLETKYIYKFQPKHNITKQGKLCVPCGDTASLLHLSLKRGTAW